MTPPLSSRLYRGCWCHGSDLLLRCCCCLSTTLQGRILNATAGGYAVGVAGYVALLQRQQASIDKTRRIGVLQEFYVHSMDSKKWRINLSNMARRESDGMKEVWMASL